MKPMPGMICAAIRCGREMLDRQRVREQREHGCAETDEEIGPQPGGPMLELRSSPMAPPRIAASTRRNKKIPAADISNCSTSRMW